VISEALNRRITQTVPGAPAGELMRRYWQPAALSDELAGDRPVTAVDLLGEKLVLFRDEEGELALIGEPEDSRMHEKIKTASYPVVEKNGIVFAYLGPGDAPDFPHFDCFRAPDTHVFAFKGLWQCNWLQAMEVGIDPAHASFLHRFLQDEDSTDSYGKQFRDKSANTDMPMTQLLREYPRPEIRVEETNYGMKLTALRHLDNGQTHVRVTNQIFPGAICIPMTYKKHVQSIWL